MLFPPPSIVAGAAAASEAAGAAGSAAALEAAGAAGAAAALEAAEVEVDPPQAATRPTAASANGASHNLALLGISHSITRLPMIQVFVSLSSKTYLAIQSFV
ncbi:MAG: hypothetical protein F2763_01775 [Actinobacteria bacterium]|nr:hypothetical protein [Actinomycetota bacterium]